MVPVLPVHQRNGSGAARGSARRRSELAQAENLALHQAGGGDLLDDGIWGWPMLPCVETQMEPLEAVEL